MLPIESIPTAAETAVEGKSGKRYRAGTLEYTLRGVLILFAWLLGGDFVFSFFESIFGRFIPLYLKEMNASNSLIGIMTGSIAGGLNLFLLPGISQWSDRLRTPWGRRIPFLALAAPLTVASLVLVGFAPEIGTRLHRGVAAHLVPALSEASVILTFLCVCVVFFHYFNMVLCNGFTWLLRDVVPQELMARFLSWLRIVSTVSATAFNWYVFPHILTRRREICVGIGLFYLGVFLLMCWKIKEGNYPPAPPRREKPGVFKSYGLYFRECFAVPLYRHYFYVIILGALGSCSGSFYLLFFKETLHLDMNDLGRIFAISTAVTAVAYLPIGWLCDRFQPIRIAIAAQVGSLLITILSFFFIRDESTLLIFTVVSSFVMVGWGLGSATFTMQLFPAEKFGQFSAGTNIFGCGVMIFGNALAGLFMDLMHSNYRMAYLWGAIGGMSLLPLLLVYRGWRRHGGPDHYHPPLP